MSYKRQTRFASLMIVAALVWGCSSTLQRPSVSQEEIQSERGKQIEMALASYQKKYERLVSVYYPLQVASAELCGQETARLTGYFSHYKTGYPENFQETADRLYLLDKNVIIRYVHPQSPAHAAGLKAGDRLLAINGQSLEGREPGEVMYLQEQALEKADRLVLRIARDGNVIELSQQTTLGCNYPPVLVSSDVVDASSAGTTIYITTGMVKFAESDSELALVLSHEFAHNALGHSAKGKIIGKRMIAGMFGYVGKKIISDSSKQNELDADYAGLYMAARARYDISAATAFWRRMAIEHPQSIQGGFGATHPDAPERFVAIEAALREIQNKKQQGLPLMPEKPSDR